MSVKRLLKFWASSLFIFLVIFDFFGSPVHAATTLTRTDDMRVIVDSKQDRAKVDITRTVSLVGPSWLVLPANSNEEVFSICSPYKKFKDYSYLKKTLKVTWNGVKLSHTLETKQNCVIIHVPYPVSLYGNRSLTIKLSFKTEEYAKYLGGVLEVIYPGFSKETKFTTKVSSQVGTVFRYYKPKVTFLINKKLGRIVSITPQKKIKYSGGYSVLSYEGKELVDKSVRLLVGNKRVVHFVIQADVNKTNLGIPSPVKKYVTNEVELLLPISDLAYGQSVVYTHLDPMPYKVYKDYMGNMRAIFRIPASEAHKIKIEGYAFISKISFNLDFCKNKKISEIVPENFAPELAQSLPYWEVDNPLIKEKAKELLSKKGLVLETVYNDVKFISKHLTYLDGVAFSNITRKGAVGALTSRSGVCMEYSDLMISLLRAQGIPARAVVGNALGLLADEASKKYGHQWVEFYCPSYGWIQVDPTWSNETSIIIGPDLDHFVHYRVYRSDKFETIVCKTFDVLGANKICENYELKVEEVNSYDPSKFEEIPAEELKKYVESNTAQQNNVVEKALNDLGATSLGRLVMTVPGIYIVSFLILILIINFFIWLWKVLFRPPSPSMY